MTEPKFIPPTFQAESDAIATYDYTDIADGTGIIIFDAYATEDVGGLDYHLGTNEFYSALIETSTSLPAGTDTVAFDIDFDLTEFQLPRTIEGIATINCGFAVTNGGTGNGNLTATLNHWDGTTETLIAAVSSKEFTSGANQYHILAMPITIPLTHFKIGDILRLSMKAWGDETVGDVTLTLGHDPKNRDGGVLTAANSAITKLEAHIPFKIEI